MMLIYSTPKGVYRIRSGKGILGKHYIVSIAKENEEEFQFLRKCNSLYYAKKCICAYNHIDDIKKLDDDYLKIDFFSDEEGE